jgi:hypothetical protein
MFENCIHLPESSDHIRTICAMISGWEWIVDLEICEVAKGK